MNLFKQVYFGLIISCGLFSCASPLKETGSGNSVQTVSHNGRNAKSVYLTTNQEGIPVMVWTEQDTAKNGGRFFYFSLLDSTANTFKDSIRIPIEENASLHKEGMPKIAFKKSGEIIAVYEVKTESKLNPYSGEIHYIVSKENGSSWSEPETVHSSKSPHKGRSFFDMITLSDGQVGVSWLGESNREGGRPVMFAKTNEANVFVSETIVDSVACECCRTAISTNKTGTISIVYRDIINDSVRDISVAVSHDNGKTFSSPVCFSGDNWNLSGCPHNGPDVVNDENGIYAVWFTGATESGVYFAGLNNQDFKADKKLVSKDGRNIQIAMADQGPMIVFNENYTKNELLYSRIKTISYPDRTSTTISDEEKQAHSPTIIIGKNNAIVTAWLETNKQSDEVKYKIL